MKELSIKDQLKPFLTGENKLPLKITAPS